VRTKDAKEPAGQPKLAKGILRTSTSRIVGPGRRVASQLSLRTNSDFLSTWHAPADVVLGFEAELLDPRP